MFKDRLGGLLEAKKNNGISATEIAMALGVKRSQISDWKSGRYQPSADNLNRIASYFNVTVDYLLQDETPSGEILGDGNVVTNPLTPQEQELVRLFRNLPVKEQTHFLAELYKKEEG